MKNKIEILTLFCAVWAFSSSSAGAAAPSPPRPPLPPRSRSEVEAALARSPGPPAPDRMRELRILLVANEKDHGLEEHDYPLWWKRWALLFGGEGASGERQVNLFGGPAASGGDALSGAPRVKVATAWGWPRKEELDSADLVMAFIGTGGRWNKERIEDLRRLLDRGGGFVAIHSAVITSKEYARSLAELLGLAWEDGTTTFRHGPVDLEIAAPDHPICLGLPPKIRFEDESYWPLVGDREKIDLLASAKERVPAAGGGSEMAPQPMFWTLQRGKGRIFACILGHYTWTFDDPYFRILLFRGMAWAARESVYRFDPIVLRGARVSEGAAAPATAAKPRKSVRPAPPDLKDPRILLWLDASDRETLTVDPDGGVTDWSGKGGRRGLSSWGSQRPRYAEDGPAGRPAVRFDGKDDILRDTGFRRSAADWTLLIAATLRSNEGVFRGLFSANKTGVNDFISGINLDLGGGSSGSFDTLNLEGSQHEGQCNLRGEPSPFGTYIITVTRRAGRAEASLNGAREGERVSRDAPASLEEIRIGGRIYRNPAGTLPLIESGFLDGDFAEFLLFGAALEEGEREGIEAYLMEKYSASLVEVHEPTLDEAFEALPRYEIGKSRFALGPIDAAISSSHGDPEARKAFEERLLAVLEGSASRDAKDLILRKLSVLGTARSVPAIAGLLADEGHSHMARSALERISGPEATAALREALPRAKGKAKEGVIDSLGRIGDRPSAPRLAELLRDPDPGIASAAASALARLGETEPLLAFVGKGSGPPAEAAFEGLLACSQRQLDRGEKDGAAGILKALLAAPGQPEPARLSAIRLFSRASPVEARPLIEDALKTGSPKFRAELERILRKIH